MQQQVQWLTGSLKGIAAVYEKTEAQACKWLLCVFLVAPSEVSCPSQAFPFHRVPGIGDKWTSEVEQPSRTAALRLSRRMAEFLSDKSCNEKGHMGVWACPVAKGREKFLRQLLGPSVGSEVSLSMVYCSVIPAIDPEALMEMVSPEAAAKEKARIAKEAKAEKARLAREAKAEAKSKASAKASTPVEAPSGPVEAPAAEQASEAAPAE